MRRVQWLNTIASIIIPISILLFEPAPLCSATDGFTFIAVGDVMLTRGVGKQIRKNGPRFSVPSDGENIARRRFDVCKSGNPDFHAWETDAQKGVSLSG